MGGVPGLDLLNSLAGSVHGQREYYVDQQGGDQYSLHCGDEQDDGKDEDCEFHGGVPFLDECVPS